MDNWYPVCDGIPLTVRGSGRPGAIGTKREGTKREGTKRMLGKRMLGKRMLKKGCWSNELSEMRKYFLKKSLIRGSFHRTFRDYLQISSGTSLRSNLQSEGKLAIDSIRANSMIGSDI